MTIETSADYNADPLEELNKMTKTICELFGDIDNMPPYESRQIVDTVVDTLQKAYGLGVHEAARNLQDGLTDELEDIVNRYVKDTIDTMTQEAEGEKDA